MGEKKKPLTATFQDKQIDSYFLIVFFPALSLWTSLVIKLSLLTFYDIKTSWYEECSLNHQENLREPKFGENGTHDNFNVYFSDHVSNSGYKLCDDKTSVDASRSQMELPLATRIFLRKIENNGENREPNISRSAQHNG